MRRLTLAVLALALLFASAAVAQTATPTATATSTHTSTPTTTPTFPNQSRIFKATDGTLFRTGTAGALSAWTEMPANPVFEFELMAGTMTWKLWCRQENSHPMSGKQISFDDGATSVAADAVLTIAGNANTALTPAATNRSFAKYCQIEIDACSGCDGIVRYSSAGE